MQAVTGNTYPHREALKRLGGKWSASRKAWLVPDDKLEQARAIVGDAPARQSRGPRVCQRCRAKINYGVYCGKCEYS